MKKLVGNMNLFSADSLQRLVFCIILCVFVQLMPRFAAAAGWNIDPVRIELTPDQQTAAMTVRNDSDQPTSIQIQAVSWSQAGGKDVYTPTKELLVSPPFVTIAPKGEQIIRLALRRQADPVNELTYRISLQELPSQLVPGFMGVQVALRIGLPVFVQSQKGEAAPKMAWNITRMPENKLKVGVRNKGNAHIQISDFELYIPGVDRPISRESSSSYILAGQEREWLLNPSQPMKIADGHVRLKAYTDADNIDTELVLDQP
jgi:fimbrial chaperone protein